MKISEKKLRAYETDLWAEDLAKGTVEKYLRDLRQFMAFLGGDEVAKERVMAWRDALLSGGTAPVTVNSKLAALNHFFVFFTNFSY